MAVVYTICARFDKILELQGSNHFYLLLLPAAIIVLVGGPKMAHCTSYSTECSYMYTSFESMRDQILVI